MLIWRSHDGCARVASWTLHGGFEGARGLLVELVVGSEGKERRVKSVDASCSTPTASSELWGGIHSLTSQHQPTNHYISPMAVLISKYLIIRSRLVLPLPMPQKSIFRQPGAKHFQLVHRSQRDPLIHNPDASQHVLKAFVRGNDKKVCLSFSFSRYSRHKATQGKTRADLEAILAPEVIEHDVRANVGEAALYGIYFDDTDYDYMQHLRAAGTEEEGVESILIEAPQSQNKSRSKGKSKSNSDVPLSLQDLPAEALPSKTEMPRNFETQQSVPSSIAGFQPDMDPHLRQALDALEDDAFVDDEVEDDFFTGLVRGGERDGEEEGSYEFHEYGPPQAESNEGEDGGEDGSWEARFAKFKKEKENALPRSDSDEDVYSEGGDTVGKLPKLPVIGGKRRRKGTSDASGYSMSSSSMYRTEALLTLDERFDQVRCIPASRTDII